MAYDRTYTLSEVAAILDASEHRVLPGMRQEGHAISVHTNERIDVFNRPKGKKGTEPKDSMFVISRNSLAGIVHEVLNSPKGQQALKGLNGSGDEPACIKSFILRQGDFDVFVVYRPEETGRQMSFDWLSTTKGDGYIVMAFVLVFKVPGSSTEEIHIHTAYPKRWRRLRGRV